MHVCYVLQWQISGMFSVKYERYNYDINVTCRIKLDNLIARTTHNIYMVLYHHCRQSKKIYLYRLHRCLHRCLHR